MRELFGQFVRISMILIAAAGAAPLRLHHAVYHADCSCADRCNASSLDSADCDAHADGSSESSEHPNSSDCCSASVSCSAKGKASRPGCDAEKFPGISSHSNHDCAVCYSLAQPSTLRLDFSELAVSSPPAYAVDRYGFCRLPSLECPPPARGPPGLLEG
jgi:hypothetical protein